ncbi:hypothetical protein QTP86_030818 [Hemibagrus guttatus]|nr:hypothetical protein QTP86_030818 [Hemibagrus guttatus]
MILCKKQSSERFINQKPWVDKTIRDALRSRATAYNVRVNNRKAAAPDGISGRVLRACTDQLAPVFTEIFNLSLTQLVIPTCFKESIIVPVPKKTHPASLNDYHPVALTSVVMKCLE